MENEKAILMDFSWDSHYGRQVQYGVKRYAQPHRLWMLLYAWSHHNRSMWRDARAAGMISIRRPRDYMASARRYGLAAVGVGVWLPSQEFSHLPYVDVDPKAVGEMAAEYFINLGFRNFGLITSNRISYPQYRGEAFVEALQRRKLTCDVFKNRKKYPSYGEPLPGHEQILRWLATLPKPLAVFCINDAIGFWLCAVCWRAGIRVPEEVAVLGADDDYLLCSMAHPHLSSIQIPAEQVGFEAAKLLDAMLSGQKPPKRPVLLQPMGVITRQSTNVMAIEDGYVTRAVRFIRENAHRGIRVENVTNEVSMSRRMLERRFKKILGRSPFSEIRRVQIEHIKMLLAQTDKTLEAMAPECGFDSVTRMNAAFRKAIGISPGAYRKQFRSR